MELRTYIRKIEDIGNGNQLFSFAVDRYRDKEVFKELLERYKTGDIISININF